MKMTMIEKPEAGEGRTSDRVRPARPGTRRSGRVQAQADADQQVADIERTFSVRWEW